MANPNPSRISDAMYDVLWVSFRKKYGSKVKLGGFFADKTGYHDTRAGQSGNYSTVKKLDKQGPAWKASAVDWTYNDKALLKLHTKRLLKAYDNPKDPRVGPHNVAEFYGTTNGYSVTGRLHGRWASSDNSHLWHLHLGVFRAFIESAYVMRAILSVVTGESLATWMKREHPPVAKPQPAPKPVVKPTPKPAPPKVYTVVKGDTLNLIAKKVGVSVPNLIIFNSVSNKNLIRVGQTLSLEKKVSQAPSQAPQKPLPVTPKKVVKAPVAKESDVYGIRTLKAVKPPMTGADVRFVQRYLGGAETGIYESRTKSRVAAYQSMRGIKRDGIVGPVTWKHMGITWKGPK